LSILLGIIQIFIARNAKHAAFFEFTSQRNNIEIKKIIIIILKKYISPLYKVALGSVSAHVARPVL
jgi:hypothetical protein